MMEIKNKRRKRKQRKFRYACGRKKEIENRYNGKKCLSVGENVGKKKEKEERKKI